MAHPAYKPTPAEAQFIGELLAIDAGLAKIALDQLEAGRSLDNVVGTYKDAMKIAALVRGAQA